MGRRGKMSASKEQSALRAREHATGQTPMASATNRGSQRHPGQTQERARKARHCTSATSRDAEDRIHIFSCLAGVAKPREGLRMTEAGVKDHTLVKSGISCGLLPSRMDFSESGRTQL